MTVTLPPICVKCKHCIITGKVYCCDLTYDVVTGDPIKMECHTVRGNQALCGRPGNWFEAKDK